MATHVRTKVQDVGFLLAQCLVHHIALEGHPTIEHVRTKPHVYFISMADMTCPESGVGYEGVPDGQDDCSEDWALFPQKEEV